MVELILEIEDEFDISISDAIAVTLHTPQDIAHFISDEYVLKKIDGCSSHIGLVEESNSMSKYSHDTSIMEKVIELTAQQFGVKPSAISNHTKFRYLGVL